MTLKTAVIGVGSMGANHARVNWELPDVDLVAIVDGDENRAQAVAKKYSTAAYSDYRKMLDEAKPDAVTLAVPTVMHHEIAIEILNRKIPLLIEKPIAFSEEEGQDIINTAKRNNTKLQIGHIERFNPAILALKELIRKDELGRIFQMEAHREGPFPARIGDVGVVIDLAVHDLDIMCFVSAQEVVHLYAETERHIHSKYEDLVAGLIRFSDGAIGTLAINWLTPTKIREFIVTGERGLAHCNYLTQDLIFYENPVANTSEWENLRVLRGVKEGRMVKEVIAKKEPLRAEQEAFLNSIINNLPVEVSGEDGLRALKLAKAMVLSGNERRIVEI